jgi:hypothetical protein
MLRLVKLARACFLLILVSVFAFGGTTFGTVTPAAQLAASPSPSGSPSPSPSPTVVTTVGERTPARGLALRQQIDGLLDEMAEAIVRKDEAGLLKAAKTDGPRGELSRRYRNLTAMRVTEFYYYPADITLDEASGHWVTNVQVSFCIVIPKCQHDRLTEPMSWADTPAGVELMAVSAAVSEDTSWYGHPQPWELSDLHVLIGPRTMVATTSRLRHRLPRMLDEAEKAAVIADQFVTAGRKPDFYRVYLADRDEWNSWYRGNPVRWAAGYAVATNDYRSDVVLNHSKVPDSYLKESLQHELAHVSTLHGSFFSENNWWIVEGIAEVAGAVGHTGPFGWASETRSYVRRGWDGKLPGTSPDPDASNEHAGRMYGIAHLGVQALETRFGREKVLDFVAQILTRGRDVNTVSPQVFGLPWAEVEAHCVAYIRQNA